MGTNTNLNVAADPQKPPGTNPERGVNTSFRGLPLLTNKQLSEQELRLLDRTIPNNEKIQFDQKNNTSFPIEEGLNETQIFSEMQL